MSESRNNYSSSSSESRSSYVRKSYPSYSSESRDSSESRSFPTYTSSSSESRNSSESRESIYSSPNKQYNNLEDIDRLIESLESSLPKTDSNNPRVNKALETRRKQIEELKKLKEQSVRKMEEDKLIRQLESQNDMVQDAINGMKRFLKRRPTTKVNSDSSESRDSGESRW